MTRLPETLLQSTSTERREMLVHYLANLSEARQVLFLRSLRTESLRFDVENRLDQLKREQKRGNSNDITGTEL